MEVKLVLKDALDISRILKMLMENPALAIEPLLKFRMLGAMKALEPDVVNFERIRNEKIMEYGKQEENGNYSIAAEDSSAMQRFHDDLSELLNSEISVSMEKIKFSDLLEKGIAVKELMRLYPIMEE